MDLMDNKKVYIFTCSEKFGELIESISKHIEGGTETLFEKSLILMAVAMKATQNGNTVAIVDKSGQVIENIEIC